MMLANTEAVETDLFSQHRFVDDFAQHLRMGLWSAGGVDPDVAKSVEAELKGVVRFAHPPTVANYCPRFTRSATSYTRPLATTVFTL